MFNFKLWARLRPSGQVVVDKIEPQIDVAEPEELFANAVRKTALSDLTEAIIYELDCMAWGVDVVDQTREAARLSMEDPSIVNIREKCPKAMSHAGCYSLPRYHTLLARQIAKDWMTQNYK